MKKFLACTMSLALCGAAIVGMTACNEEKEKPNTETKSYHYSVYAPDGAPALALCNLIEWNQNKSASAPAITRELSFDCHVVDANTIQTYVTGADPSADFCILPVNAAAKILGTGEKYQMLGTVTNGNLYFLSGANKEVLTAENLKTTLTGKMVGVIQLANVPGLTLQAVLNDYGIEYQTLQSVNDGASLEKVNLIPFTPDNVTPAGGCDYYLCPEPAASTKIKGTASSANPFQLAGDLQELYGAEEGYPQAVLVAKKEAIEESEESGAVAKIIEQLNQSGEYLSQAEPEKIIELLAGVRTEGLTPSFQANNLTKEVVANCSVRFSPSSSCKQKVLSFLNKLIAVKSDSTTVPNDKFFYMG